MGERVLDENDIASYVRSALQAYFADLDGEQPASDMYGMVMDSVEKPLLETVLAYTEGNQTRAAEVLGINRSTLRKKMKKQDI